MVDLMPSEEPSGRWVRGGSSSALLRLVLVCWPVVLVLLVMGEPRLVTARAMGTTVDPIFAQEPEAPPLKALDLEEAELRPGLVAEYTAAGPEAVTVVRVDAKPAFTWGVSTPHPRLAPGAFEVAWTGLLNVRATDRVRFRAFAGGDLKVTLGDREVLRARGGRSQAEAAGAGEHAVEAGLHPFQVKYRSTTGVAARVQVWWEGRRFAREPLPAALLKHQVSGEPAELAREHLRESGRSAVGRLGCARCHADSFPAVAEPPPGPSLTGLGGRVRAEWLMGWLDDPRKLHGGATMPALFTADRPGYTERWLITQHLLGDAGPSPQPVSPTAPTGDHRAGQQQFVGLGCIACHVEPEARDAATGDRRRLQGLGDRMTAKYLAAFLTDPQSRYADGRMPKLPVTPAAARDLTAYLLRTATATTIKPVAAPTRAELEQALSRLGQRDPREAARLLLREKGCVRCHDGLGEPTTANVPLRADQDAWVRGVGCLSSQHLPRFGLDAATHRAVAAYGEVARQEKHPSPFFARQNLIESQGCVRCHQRDRAGPSPLELAGRDSWSPHLYRLPFQRTPALTQASAKFHHAYLLAAVRDGVSGVRADWYSYRMPAYGARAQTLVQALIEGDGDLPDAEDESKTQPTDPQTVTLGSTLAGFGGYGCVSCHVWGGKSLSAVEPGSAGPDLAVMRGRIKREWFERFVDDPQRVYPGTPMPSIFRHGEPAALSSILAGDAARQKEALWAFLTAGRSAPTPAPRPPLTVAGPEPGASPFVAQVPVLIATQQLVEGLVVWFECGDLALFEVNTGRLFGLTSGATLLRQHNVWRTLQLAGTAVGATPLSTLRLARPTGPEDLQGAEFQGYERLPDGARLRWKLRFPRQVVEWVEVVRVRQGENTRQLVRTIETAIPQGHHVMVSYAGASSDQAAQAPVITAQATTGSARVEDDRSGATIVLTPAAATGKLAATVELRYRPERAPARAAPAAVTLPTDPGIVGPLERPGYRAVLYPRPKTAQGEDLVMPAAVTADPRTGQVFVASMKQGEVFAVEDPSGDGKQARYRNYARGLFQDCFGLLHDGEALFVLHRRNLTRLHDADGDGVAERATRVAAIPHATGNAYDWAYGLVRDRRGRFLWTLAPHAHPHQPGAGALVRFTPGTGAQEELAFGFRNPLGWCTGPEGEVFFTDNQGDWCATNKLCHVQEGKYYGYPNAARPEQRSRPAARTAVWVPYAWAKSINGVAYDASGGQFGPFAGQFFLAELMHGGAVVRAQVEKVNGVYQGACFPFWGKGLLGPLALAFDAKGRLWVGAVTTPGWMGEPDRGALFRLEPTGTVPFEIESIHVLPRGFRLRFTKAVDPSSAVLTGTYQLHHYRYEYTGAYGSPELDRTTVRVVRAELHRDGRTVDVLTEPLVRDRVYSIAATHVRATSGERLVHDTGVYTLNEIPGEEQKK